MLLAGVGELITEVAGEIADGYLVHGFTTERYLREVSLPTLARGQARRAAGGPDGDFLVCGSPMVATGATEEKLATAADEIRAQIAFYGSTPAYRPVLALHGWGELGDELYALSRQGRWAEMGRLVHDDLLHAVAVVAEPDAVGPEIVRRCGDVFDRVTLFGTVEQNAAIAADIRAARAPAPVAG